MIQYIFRILTAIPTVVKVYELIKNGVNRFRKARPEEPQGDKHMEEKITKEKVEAVKAKLNELKISVIKLKEQMWETKGVAPRLKLAIKIVPDVVKAVEAVSAEIPASGEEKKELAIKVINDLIDIPYLPETLEAVIIGFAIDVAVDAFNKAKGWAHK